MIPFSVETKQALLSAVEEATRLRHREIGIAHVLLGLLRDEHSVAASVLVEKGLFPQDVPIETECAPFRLRFSSAWLAVAQRADAAYPPGWPRGGH